MNKKMLSIAALVLSQGAFAFSTSALTYSKTALQLILDNNAIINQIPQGESITAIEQVSRNPYRFDVKAGKCTLTVELSTKTPPFFIGNGLPTNPKVVDASGCAK